MSRLTQRSWLLLGVASLALTVAVPATVRAATASAPAPAAAAPIPFTDARLIIEVNGTDGDAGLQVFLDAQPWRQIAIQRPDGSRILDTSTRGTVRDYGLTELFSESSEPPFTEFPLAKFKQLFPAGRYTFTGQTIDGKPLRSTAVLSHDIPTRPRIVKPRAGATVRALDTEVRWQPARQPRGVDIVGYEVIVLRSDPKRVFSVELPANRRSVEVPDGFLQRGVEYKVEVLAIEASGNKTLTEVAFHTA